MKLIEHPARRGAAPDFLELSGQKVLPAIELEERDRDPRGVEGIGRRIRDGRITPEDASAA